MIRALLVMVVSMPLWCLGQGRFDDHPINTWVKQSPREGAGAPKFGWEGSGAFDPVSKLWIHHAGHDGNPQGFITFTADLVTGKWRQLFPPTSPPGVCCVDGSNVFDSVNGVFVRFPGGSLGHGYQWSRGVKLKDSAVWLFDPAAGTWTNMRPPPYGEVAKKDVVGGLNPTGACDPTRGLAITFGGQGAGGSKNNLHFYDAWSNTLTQIRPAKGEAWPSERDGVGLAVDTKHDKLVLFGSQYSDDERTWIFDLKTQRWEGKQLDPHPPAKKGKKTYSTIPKMTYDSVNEVLLCVVWIDEQGGHETWALDLGKMAWTKLNPAMEAEPSKSRTRNLDFSAADNLAIMETWSVKGEPQLWTYRYAAGKGAKAAGGRPARKDPRVAVRPVVSVLSNQKVEVSWNAHPANDIAGYNVYRGTVTPRTVIKGTPGAWKDNDPQYEQPVVVGVKEISEPKKLNEALVTATSYTDAVDLSQNPAAEYRYGVYAYIVRAVNRAGVESGPSPYALTIPSEPLNVLCREAGENAELKWSAALEKGVVGYHVYKLEGGVWGIKRVTEAPLTTPAFTHRAGKQTTRYWVVTVDALGQEGQPSSPAWFNKSYKGFFEGEWHQ